MLLFPFDFVNRYLHNKLQTKVAQFEIAGLCGILANRDAMNVPVKVPPEGWGEAKMKKRVQVKKIVKILWLKIIKY